MTATPYKSAAFKYFTHGWKGPIPVGTQPRQKNDPPAGYTGNEGAWPDEDQIAQWVRSKGDLNIALRLPDDVIGIDVDDYDEKPGADTMIAVTEAHGKLPRTWITTSREGTRSGIRWFRLPEPGVLPGKLLHPDDPSISGVEIIQHTHRYAIVPPSIHPEGRPYRWVKPDGTETGDIPRPADLPMIPQAWIDHIRQDCSCWAPFDWNRYQETPGNDPVEAAYRKWAGRMTETYGRHDAALGGAMALVAFRERGWPGAQHWLDQLQADFYRSLGDSRSQPEAEAEWQRMIEGAEKKAATTHIPQWQPQQTRHTPETFDERVEEELQRLLVRDAAQRRFRQETRPPQPLPEILTLRERLQRPQPPIAWRIEGWQPAGTRVLLAAQYKAGKTTLTANLTRCLVDNRPWLDTAAVQPIVTGHVTILDFEMSERQLDSWLGDQGIERDDKVLIVPLRGKAGSFDILDPEIRSQWAKKLRGTEYLIFDCVRPVLDALGLDEHHEAGRFLTAFDALCDEAGIDDSLVVHHMGHQGERSRGDSRLRDWPDVEWRLVREDDNPASPRYISAFGRDVEQPESRLEYHPDSRHLTLIGGSRSSAPVRAALEDILELLAEDPDRQWSKNAIVAELSQTTSHGRNDIRRAIDLGVENGQIHRRIGPRNSQLHSHRATAPHRATTAPAQSLTTAPVPIGHGAVVNPQKPPSTAPTAPTPQGGCEVCGKPGDLARIKGEFMHPECAPQGWEPTPEEIAP